MRYNPEAIVRRSPNQLSCDLNGEFAILNIRAKKYFGLTYVGAFIWDLLEYPKTLNTISIAVLEHFEVEDPRCTADVNSFLENLEQKGLLEVNDDGLSKD